MKSLLFFSILYFIIAIQSVFSIRLCLPEKYKKYQEIFTKAYGQIVNGNHELDYNYHQSMEDYVKSFSLYKCDVAMIEPPLYDYYFEFVKDINSYINTTAEIRMSDEVDGEIYRELLKDIQVNNRQKVRALPMFLDYGVLYYRSDIDEEPPQTWDDLSSISDYLYEIEEFQVTDTVYIGQFNEYREFFYNLFENVLNTREPITYEVIEKETNFTIDQFKTLFDSEIIDEYAWHLNSEYGVIRFNDEKAIYMRNWSSFLYNVTTEYNKKTDKTFGVSKMLYSDKRFDSSRAINKGIYLCIANTSLEENFDDSLQVLETFSSKEFLQILLNEEIFYDLPVYHSLILEDNGVDNEAYCKRINCNFFRELAEDHIIATYSAFYQDEFLSKLNDFFEKAKAFFKEAGVGEVETNGDKEVITLESLMSLFSNYFQDKYVEWSSATTIIMIIIVVIEILVTSVVTYYLIKHRNFIEIRRSSPLFLITMLIGIILAFASILTFIGKPTKFICILRPYILVLTFGLTFFSLLLKTFRIKVIFDKVNIQVKDSNLILYLCIMLGYELILVTIWSIAAGMEPLVKEVNKEMHYYVCQNTKSLGEYIQMSLIIINGLALVYGCYLAYKVKNVYSEYNESKVIGLSIYGIVICMIILMFIVNINGLDHTTLFLIQSLMIILSADIILVFMFTPKLWKLHINIISEISYEKPAPAEEGERKNSNHQEPQEDKNSIKNNAMNE